MPRYLFLSIFFISLIAFNSCNIEGSLPPENEVNIFATTEEIPELSIFREAVEISLLAEPLAELGPLTVFAPSNEAFENTFREFGVSNIRQIPPDALQGLLLYHIIIGRQLSKNLRSGSIQTFLPETSLELNVSGSSILINGEVSIIRRDIEAVNGMIHMVDAVIFPPSNTIMEALDSNGNTIMFQALIAAGLAELLSSEGPFTLFAPSNNAFERFLEDNLITGSELLESPELQDILRYHIVNGVLNSTGFNQGPVNSNLEISFYISEAVNGNLWLNGIAGFNSTNINADNGIIHVIDYVLTPPRENIVQFLSSSANNSEPEFRILIEAIQIAGLEDELSGDATDDLTLFAPTDAAFEGLFETLQVSGLNEIPVAELRNILLFHVHPNRLFSQGFREDEPLQTLVDDQEITVDIANMNVNDSGLIPEFLNTLTLNGVIHGIDTVMVPD
ncbi:Sensory subunit of low CO2-induced protein complex, putative [Indibacter alkaliphilus LW1]|uniref:Sensory subunit of low CO2-induced protein complex, putative n=1 Tax=Indibacter alkaliphilus (strain CCUG 57479 / KCTC 22604 / LW1) TaxID=1189612 RepID=S2DJ97_INDAL|nr:fasciclin domain-containing protein [Indibacter alkaliphilus]EOZ92026.1 Sensory subunit of low CO2-induced protein complex, putative [Indibacter alkaliphilus LW1]